jgi:hypothetical protein
MHLGVATFSSAPNWGAMSTSMLLRDYRPRGDIEGIGTPDMSEMQDALKAGVREAARTTQLPNWWGSMADGWGRCAPRMEVRDLCRICPVYSCNVR